ncbi:MAG: SusC/RagA family TonB-linked outer membrane protein [Bacteroidales bacterium]
MKKESRNMLLLLSGVLSAYPGHSLLANQANISTAENSLITASVTQNQEVKGNVVDEAGEPLIGVNIQVKGTTIGGTTDIDGNFSIKAKRGDVLVVSYVGYTPQEVKVTSSLIKVVLKEDSENLQEVVVTAFGSGQKKASLVGSIQTVKPQDLKVPSSSLSTSFAGRMAGVVAYQRTGEPGADGASFFIRGISTFSGATSPLIIIDGVQVSAADLNALSPEVIESFSILKDATATALYGTRGANGVMIVTTKSGKDMEKPRINFRLEGRMSQPTKVPKTVDGQTYMRMFNEAVTGRSTGEVLYSEDKINNTLPGADPYIYPNVDWYDEMFNNTAWSQNFNFNITGGTKRVDYFMNVNVVHESGMLKSRSKEFFSYNNNIDVMKYNFQNNLNINLSETSRISLRLNTQFRDYKGPISSANSLFGMVMEANPVDFPITFPQDESIPHIMWGGKNGGRFNSGYRNPMAEMVKGYQDNFQSTVLANLEFQQKLDFITKGLKFNTLVSFKNWSQTSVSRNAGYNQYEIKGVEMDEEGNPVFTTQRVGDELSVTLGTSGSNTGDRRIYIQGSLDYSRQFGDHDVNALFVYNQDQYDVNNPGGLMESLSRRKQGIAGRLGYSYKGKYVLEGNFGYNGSENFAAGNRWGFFPSVAVGYNISEENFWRPLENVIDFMKIRGSYGLVGNDQIGGERFIYLSDIDLSGKGYTTGIDQNYSVSGPSYLRFENKDITWEIGEKLNVGVEMNLFRAFRLSIDGFQEIRKNIFMKRGTVPTFMGTASTNVYGNFGKVKSWGTDMSVDYIKNLNKDLTLTFKGTFTLAKNKILEYDEPAFQLYPQLSRIGQPLNRYSGYIADRLFIDNAEVANSPTQVIGGTIMGGDIKYIDQPNIYGQTDGRIDGNDARYIGNPTVPQIVYGFGPNIRWKKFDMGIFFQGVGKTSLMMSGFHPFGSSSTRNILDFVAADYWSETNPNVHAAYPRLSKMDISNNTANSTYWLRDGSFLKLKNVELGYTYRKMRFFVTGANLLTFSKFKLWDPEMGGGAGMSYPTQRDVTFGFQMTIN